MFRNRKGGSKRNFRRSTRNDLREREKEWRRMYPEAFRKKSRHVNRHHMTNKCRGGKDNQNNILMIDIGRHRNLHKLFGNMSWEQICDTLKSIFGVGEPAKVIAVMERVARMKGRAA